jgi:hypothetical protein
MMLQIQAENISCQSRRAEEQRSGGKKHEQANLFILNLAIAYFLYVLQLYWCYCQVCADV